ncbi:MAG TPA: TonB-dependent receptor [Vicinamibacterales bacterium]|nr:TonB-dependent receptor [Vicinamibacterales bacterium]
MLLIGSGSLQAEQQNPTTPAGSAASEPTLETITITASRTPASVSDLTTSLSQIEEDDLQTQLGMSTQVLQTLDVLVPGLTVSQGEFRSGCRTNIRGRPAQFLINGVPTNDNLRRSQCDSLFSLSPFAIERIEVLRGATALFGAGAPGGAINLQTRQARSQKLEIDAVAQYSINPHERSKTGETNAYLGAGQKFGAWDYYLGGGFQDYGVRRNPEDGIIQGDTFQSYSLNGSLGWNFGSAGALRLTGLYFIDDPDDVYGTDFTQISGERLASSAFIARPPNPFADDAETEQTVLLLSYDVQNVLGHSLNVSTYWHDEQLIQRAADFFEGDVFYFNSDAENQRLGLRTTLNRHFTMGGAEADIAYGVDLLRQRYYRPEVDPADGDAVIGFISPEVILKSYALFLQPKLRHGAWLLTGGVRHEEFRGKVGSDGFDSDTPNAATPGDIPDFDLTLYNIGLVYDLRRDLQIYGGFSQGAEIAEFGRAARGALDPDLINLNAAKSDQYELGLRGRQGPVEFSGTVFYSESDKAANLQEDASCEGEPICPLIPQSLEQELYGLELTADWTVTRSLKLGGIATYQEGKFKAPGERSVPFDTSTISPPRSTVYAAFEPLPSWHNRIQVSYYGKTHFFDSEEEASGLRESTTVFLVDVSTGYPVGPGELTLGIANLFDRKYVNVTNAASGDFFYYLSEGTRATLGYVVRF